MKIFSKAKLSGAILFLITSTSALSAVTVRDIGVFGLYSHDLFQWDRKNEVSLENGKFGSSTIFDYENGKRWKRVVTLKIAKMHLFIVCFHGFSRCS